MSATAVDGIPLVNCAACQIFIIIFLCYFRTHHIMAESDGGSASESVTERVFSRFEFSRNRTVRFNLPDPLYEILRGRLASRQLFRFGEVITALQQYVRDNNLSELTNTAIVRCDPELEAALGVGAFHILDANELVEKHLTIF